MILRPRQITFVDNCVNALKKNGNTLAIANTGFGKTVALSAITKKIINKTRRALIVAHRDELTTQNSDTFREVAPNVPVSFYTAKQKSFRGQATFSMVQTLSQEKNLKNLPPMDMVVYDEAHHAASNSYRKITARLKELNSKVKILGVTATPERSDNRGLKDTFDNVADIVSIGEMVAAGHLVPPRAYIIDIGTQNELNHVKKTANDYNMAEVEAIMNRSVLNDMIVNKWSDESADHYSGDRISVSFCSTIQHALDVRDAFKEHGFVSECVHGKLALKERRAILKDYNSGNIQVLTNPMILTEGWDCQIVSNIMLLRPSSHKSTMIQMIGRGLRKVDTDRYPGVKKTDCTVLDFGVSLLNHGDLDTSVHLKHDTEKETGEPNTKDCPDCSSTLPIQARVCPLCGYEFKCDPDDEYDELQEFRMIEIELINKSPFKWVSIFESEKILISSGFESFTVVCSADNENWFSIGKIQADKKPSVLGISNKIGAISTADDFMRKTEKSQSAKKAARWMHDHASQKQMTMLTRLNYSLEYVSKLTKVEAAAHITFRFNQAWIEKLMGL